MFSLFSVKDCIMTTDNQLKISLPSKWLKVFGIVFIIGGIAALIVPAIAGIAMELLLGWLFFCRRLYSTGISDQHA